MLTCNPRLSNPIDSVDFEFIERAGDAVSKSIKRSAERFLADLNGLKKSLITTQINFNDNQINLPDGGLVDVATI